MLVAVLKRFTATVGLGVSDFGYRIFGFSGFMSSMDWYSGMAKEKEETVHHEECINTTICTVIALQSIHLF